MTIPVSPDPLLQQAVAFKAMQLLHAAQTGSYDTEESRARYFVSQRYAGVFFDLTTRAMLADAERDSHIGEALIADYRDAHPDYTTGHPLPPVIPPVNYADTILIPTGAFTKLTDPILRAGIDSEAHYKQDLLKTLNTYTGKQLQELIKERNTLAAISLRNRGYQHNTLSYTIGYIVNAWNKEIAPLMERQLPHYRPANVTPLLFDPPDNLELLSHWHREAPPPHTPAPPASTGADNVISFADRAKKKKDEKDENNKTTPPEL